MKKILLTAAICVLACAGLSAQPPGGGQGGQRGPRGVNLDEIPGITADQKTKVEAEVAKQQEEMQKLFNGGNADRDQMMTKMQELQTATNAEVAKILNEEQYKVYIQKQEEMRQRGPQGGGGRGQGGPPQSSAAPHRNFGQPFADRFEQPQRPREMARARVADQRSHRPELRAQRDSRRPARPELAPRQRMEHREMARPERPVRPERPAPEAMAEPA